MKKLLLLISCAVSVFGQGTIGTNYTRSTTLSTNSGIVSYDLNASPITRYALIHDIVNSAIDDSTTTFLVIDGFRLKVYATNIANAQISASANIAESKLDSTLARDTEVTAAIAALSTVYQPLDSDLTSIAALSTTAFGRSILTLADASAARTLFALIIGTDVQAFDSDLTDLADGSLTGTKVGFADTDNNYTATDVQTAIEEMDDVINGGLPNAATGKIDWSQIVNVPAGIADGTDAEGAPGSGDDVLINGAQITHPNFTNTASIFFYIQSAVTNVGAYATNLVSNQITDGTLTSDDLGADSVSASELNATGVEAELEAVLDLPDIQGAVTDAQVPNNITITPAGSDTYVQYNLAGVIAGSAGVTITAITNLSVGNLIVTNGVAILGNGTDPGFDVWFDADGSHHTRYVATNAMTTNINNIESVAPYPGVRYAIINAATNLIWNNTNTLAGLEAILGGVNIIDSTELGAGGTVFNDIGDTTGNGSVSLGHTNIWTFTLDGSRALQILSSDADNNADTTLLTLAFNDTADANSIFLNMIDTAGGTPNSLFTISATAITSTLPLSIGTSAAATVGSIELSHASANTLTGSSGDLLIEGNRNFRVGGADVPVADGGTGLSSGTSGGVLAYTASGTLASSAALSANAIVIGGGAGVVPSTTTTAAGALTFIGTPSSANLRSMLTDEVGTGTAMFTRVGTYRTIWVDAGAMVSRTTAGAAAATEELASNDIMLDYFAFDDTTAEAVQFKLAMPDEWDRGTIKLKLFWYSESATTSHTAVWGVKARAVSNDDALDGTWGTEIEVSDDVIAAGDLHVTAATGAITVGGTPALGDLIMFEVDQDAAEADHSGDVKLTGVMIQYLESATEQSAW